MTIFVPWKLPSELGELLFALHPHAKRLVSYHDEVAANDTEGIIRFLLERKDWADNFVYLDSEAHVAAATLERLTYGCVTRNSGGGVSVLHYAHDPSVPAQARLRLVVGLSTKSPGLHPPAGAYPIQ